MNILVLSNNPDRASFRQRIGIYTEYLKKAGINCCIEKLPEKYVVRWQLFRKSNGFDGVFLHKKCLNRFDAQILRKHARKIIYDFDDAVMYSPHNPQKDNSSHFRLFKRTASIADVIIAGNSYLAEHAGQFNPNVHILPTGLDTKGYDTEIQKPDDGKIRLVWIGSKSTIKYLAGIKPAIEEVGSIFKQATLRMICDDFLNFKNIFVEKRFWSKQTEIRDLKQCDIGIAPLPDNRFTKGKCGFKIVQYFSAGLPVVVSNVGVQKEYAADGRGLVSSDEKPWFENLAFLINSPDARVKMRGAGNLWVRQYDTAVLAEKLCEIIKNTVNQKSSA